VQIVMLFNTMPFAVYFAVVVPAYFLCPVRARWLLLLAASYFFYMCWEPAYAILIATSTLVDYVCALRMARTSSSRLRRALLLLSLAINLGLLGIFKYYNFFARSFDDLFGWFSIRLDVPELNVLLPVGISFYTFQTLSYTIDVYLGRIQPERHLGRFALYVSFFPQLVAGPIERAGRLLPQLRTHHPLDFPRIMDGLRQMGWGLFKKVVIADRLALYVDSIYDNVGQHDGPSYLVATYFFAFQIYCDFSGYSDIAIGAARVLGVDLTRNFDRPYFATSIRDFWRRWHISLSTWLRDYLYIPLGGSRHGEAWTYLNLMITMLLGGLWHGANWTFVVWGALQGMMLSGSRWGLPHRDRLVEKWNLPQPAVNLVRIVVTFHLVCLSWVFFRARNVGEAWHIVTHLFEGWPNLFIHMESLALGGVGIVVLLIVQCFQSRGPVRTWLERQPLPVRWAFQLAVLAAIVLFGMDGGTQFIYFQF
jgi:D-alanyl-lipoteichoic acid acyltransferase DltB (MBOAT superfamily)